MSEQAKEAFSGFLDDEASELDIQRMLNELDKNPNLLAEYRSIALTRDGMQGEVLLDVSGAIRQQLSSPFPEVSGQHQDTVVRQPKLWLRVMQGTVAASVAGLLIVAVQFWKTQSYEGSAPSVAQNQSQSVAETDEERLATALRLQQYVQQHIQDAGYLSGQAAIPMDSKRLESEIKQGE
ncbi:sigma-E factor negative regulatory protein [Gynuella sp.]|uniref:sigma-E factor negative regulatory protein n=1 Tax=Gynuella sp. TaxID=2969146 RepID=UPI003D0E669D